MQAVPTSKGQALADEYGIKFFETVGLIFIFYFCCVLLTSVLTEWNDLVDTWFPKRLKLYVCASWWLFLQSAKTNLNVEQVFFSIARDIKQRLAESDSKPEVQLQSCSSF
jgi:Ras-related protein Rab-8A